MAAPGYDYLSAPVPGTAGGGGGGLGLQELDGIHELEPEKFILNTEACTLRSLNQDWKTAALYMVDIIGDLNHWYGACESCGSAETLVQFFQYVCSN